jgi:hypothetical protein
MDDTIEVFATEGEALAFIEGLETAQDMIDDDHLTWDEPVVENGQWIVRVRFLV